MSPTPIDPKTDTSDKTRYIVEKHIPRNERRKKERDSQKIKRKFR